MKNINLNSIKEIIDIKQQQIDLYLNAYKKRQYVHALLEDKCRETNKNTLEEYMEELTDSEDDFLNDIEKLAMTQIKRLTLLNDLLK